MWHFQDSFDDLLLMIPDDWSALILDFFWCFGMIHMAELKTPGFLLAITHSPYDIIRSREVCHYLTAEGGS